MSNRIDLTQFEKITAGEWSIIRNGNRIDIGVGTSSAYSPIITFTAELAEVVMGIERDVADMNAIAAIPNLIAELKRCYKQNDLLTKAFMMAGNNGCYMTMCEECDDVHTPDDECPASE